MAADPVLERLTACSLFAGLRPKTLRVIRGTGKEMSFRDGDEITEKGRRTGRLYVILEGTAKVLVDGREVGRLGPGDSLGEISLLDGEPRSATVVAVGDVHTWTIASWNFRPLLHEHPTIADAVIQQLCRLVRVAGATARTG